MGSAKRAHSVPVEYREESMPDAEPSPPQVPPQVPPSSTVAKVAQHMATAKKAKKKKHVTPDEMLDLLLAEYDRKKAKAATKAVITGD